MGLHDYYIIYDPRCPREAQEKRQQMSRHLAASHAPMLSSTVARRVAGVRIAARHPAQTVTVTAREYATASPKDEDPQLQGYPQLPYVSRQYLPAKGWQDSLMRRNVGDTVRPDRTAPALLSRNFLADHG